MNTMILVGLLAAIILISGCTAAPEETTPANVQGETSMEVPAPGETGVEEMIVEDAVEPIALTQAEKLAEELSFEVTQVYCDVINVDENDGKVEYRLFFQLRNQGTRDTKKAATIQLQGEWENKIFNIVNKSYAPNKYLWEEQVYTHPFKGNIFKGNNLEGAYQLVYCENQNTTDACVAEDNGYVVYESSIEESCGDDKPTSADV
jgi:hypothetical protein